MTDTRKVLITVLPLNDRHLDFLKERASGGQFSCRMAYKQDGLTVDDVADVDAIIGNVPVPLLRSAKKLKWLQLNSAGADPYDRPGALPEGCALTTASGAYGLTVSEHMLALTFALVRRLNQYMALRNEGRWQSCGHVTSVEGSVVLALGLGDIGGSYARKMKALGATVIGVRRHGGEKPDFIDEMRSIEELDELLPRADIVAMALPGTPETFRLMDERRLRLMKKSAYLINVGRGTAVDLEALRRVLADDRLAGAALDVTDPEPLPPENPLWRMDKVIITPHVAGYFFLAETVNRIVRIAGENLRDWTHGFEMKGGLRR
ncbi:MAG: D-2-hydroxyacid dehydrogenase [Pyramidobacter sp.]|jgi:phosphoglycerate dehydrogenase-like enzyme